MEIKNLLFLFDLMKRNAYKKKKKKNEEKWYVHNIFAINRR